MPWQQKAEKQQKKSVALRKVCPVHKGMAVTCCCVAMAALTPVALVQLKVIRDLPDLPGRIFNSRRIVKSKRAYRFGIPDGVLGLASYGITLGLLIASKPSRPFVGKALRAKLALDATMAVRSVRSQITQHERICSWCLGTAVATGGMVYFARRMREEEQPHLV